MAVRRAGSGSRFREPGPLRPHIVFSVSEYVFRCRYMIITAVDTSDRLLFETTVSIALQYGCRVQLIKTIDSTSVLYGLPAVTANGFASLPLLFIDSLGHNLNFIGNCLNHLRKIPHGLILLLATFAPALIPRHLWLSQIVRLIKLPWS